MGSTDPSAVPGAPTSQHADYLVPDWVRVREEDFGLLFYDVRSTRLTFVRCGRDLVAPSFAGPGRVLSVREPGGVRQRATTRILENLLTKGLIIAAESE